MDSPVAIVTGAGRGIGRSAAIRLTQAGYRCVLVSRSLAELEETAGMCDGRTMVLPVDIREADSIAPAVDRVTAEFGRIDVLINNAGFAKLVPFAETDIEAFNDTVAVNLAGPFHFSRAVWKPMITGSGGVIVNISSLASRDPFKGFSAYGATKAALNLLTLAMAREGKPDGIRVHGIAPGGVETALLRSVVSTEHFPSEMAMTPDEVAGVILQCVNGDLRHTSGETIFVEKSV